MTAAPYCYGPVSKLLCLAGELAKAHSLIFVGMEPALSLAKSFAFDDVIPIADRDAWNGQALSALANADALVSFLEYRAIPLALAARVRSYFFDTLSWLREVLPPHCVSATAYVSQRFFVPLPGHVFRDLPSHHLVGPILSPDLDFSPAFGQSGSSSSVLVNFGGLRSPSMTRGADRAYVDSMLNVLTKGLASVAPITVCLPMYLRDLDPLISSRFPALEILYPTQRDFHRRLTRCRLVLTVPGLETVLESLYLGSPIAFLPPYNGTQLRQLLVYNSLNIPLFTLSSFLSGPHFVDTDLATLTKAVQEHNITAVSAPGSIDLLAEILRHSYSASFSSEDLLIAAGRRNRSLFQQLGSDGRREAALLVAGA